MRRNNETVPAGYAPWPGSYDRNALFLPSLLVQDLTDQEEQARALAKEREGDARVADEEASGKITASVEKMFLSAWERDPLFGLFRVMPNCAQLASQKARSNISDKDISAAREGVRVQLLRRGPDRVLAGPRADLCGLSKIQELQPNFSGVVEMVRNALTLGRVTGKAIRIPPILLLGPPGVGKTFFTHNLAEVLGAPHGAIAFDQPTAGNQLRGSDKHWSNSESGLLFNLCVLGTHANPIVLLDEIDKAEADSGGRRRDPLAQLHGALEPQTARCLVDISADLEFDASLVTYIATANDYRKISPSILSRFEVFYIEAPGPAESLALAERLAESALARFELGDRITFDPKSLVVLAALTPRAMKMAIEKAIAQALAHQTSRIRDVDIWEIVGFENPLRYLH